MFDVDDIDAAIAELDARYVAGEAAAHARTWSVITAGHAAVNRHELPPTTPECVSIDHRRVAAFAPGEVIEYIRAGWELKQDIRTYVEVVHRLSDLGAVYTHAAHGDFARGLRRRVAWSRPDHGRRRSGQPRRSLRRGGPRRRARSV